MGALQGPGAVVSGPHAHELLASIAAGVLDGVYEEFDSQNPSRAAMRTSISRRFGVESVSIISHRDIKVTPDSGGFLVEADYDHTTPFIGNIYFTVRFEKEVLVRR